MKFFEHYKRSIAKTVSYRVFIIISTFIISLIVTGKLDHTLNITISATVINTLIYYTHERIWNHVHWGKQKK